MAYTTTEFVRNVKTRAAVPTSQSTFTTAKILAAGDAEIRSYILPLLLKSREYYYAYDVDTAINSTGIYDIPTRAIGSQLVNAALIDGTSRLDLNWITEDRLNYTDNSETGQPGVFVKRSQVILVPPTSHGYSTFRQTISLRPGELVETSSAAQITAISGTTLTFTSGTIPSTFTTNQTYDLIQANPNFDHLGIDLTASTVTSTTVVLSSSPSSRLAVGDWLSLKTQSPIIQIPLEMHALLEQKVASLLITFQGDLEHVAKMERDLAKMEKEVMSLFTPRIQKEGKKIKPRSSMLRRV